MDVRISDHGSLVMLKGLTAAGITWLAEHLPEDAPVWGGSIAVEPRYVNDILHGMQEDGVTFSSIF